MRRTHALGYRSNLARGAVQADIDEQLAIRRARAVEAGIVHICGFVVDDFLLDGSGARIGLDIGKPAIHHQERLTYTCRSGRDASIGGEERANHLVGMGSVRSVETIALLERAPRHVDVGIEIERTQVDDRDFGELPAVGNDPALVDRGQHIGLRGVTRRRNDRTGRVATGPISVVVIAADAFVQTHELFG